MAKRLDVFLSSNATEFKSERKHLSKKISKISFLDCTLLEDRGPKAQNTKVASLRAVRECDMLIGILGDTDSEITRAEIEEAYKKGKYCLIYLKKSESENEEIDKFIKEFVMSNLTYHTFKDRKDLYSMITGHLEDHVFKILKYGLKYFKKEQQKMIKKQKETEIETKRKIKTKNYTAKDILREAKKSFEDGDYLSSVIKSGMSLELELKHWLIRTKQLPESTVERRTMGHWVRMIQDKQIMDRIYTHNMMEIRMMRNQAVHEAKVPSKESAQIAIVWAEELIKKLRT